MLSLSPRIWDSLGPRGDVANGKVESGSGLVRKPFISASPRVAARPAYVAPNRPRYSDRHNGLCQMDYAHQARGRGVARSAREPLLPFGWAAAQMARDAGQGGDQRRWRPAEVVRWWQWCKLLRPRLMTTRASSAPPTSWKCGRQALLTSSGDVAARPSWTRRRRGSRGSKCTVLRDGVGGNLSQERFARLCSLDRTM